MDENLQQPAADYSFSPAYVQMIRKMASDMKFVGIFSIVYGAITCLGIITAIIGVPMIIAGIKLKDASDMFKRYITNNEHGALAVALEKQGRFFFITKVLMIISIVLTVLYIIGIIVLLVWGIIPPFKDHAI